jgi:D-3-phosphoglycerate dehydrogenase
MQAVNQTYRADISMGCLQPPAGDHRVRRSTEGQKLSINPIKSEPAGDGTVSATAMTPLTVLATSPSGPLEELAPLRAAGLDVVIGRPLDAPGRRPWSEADLIEAVRAADIVLAHVELFSRPVLSASERLQLVIVPFIGVDKIDVAAATELGVLVANSPTPENFVAVAEATVALILMLQKRVKHNEAKLRSGGWGHRDDRGEFLFGKTVGLIGLGRVGSRVARRLAGWDVRLIAYDPYVDPARAAELDVTLVDLPTLLAQADVVSLHPTLTGETRRMIDEKALRQMKPTAILVNTARGEVTDEEAVARAVEARWIAGAALDAFTQEPLPADSALRRVDPERMILTPHNISHSEAGRRANLKLALDQVLALARGEVPAHVVNPAAIPRWRARRDHR